MGKLTNFYSPIVIYEHKYVIDHKTFETTNSVFIRKLIKQDNQNCTLLSNFISYVDENNNEIIIDACNLLNKTEPEDYKNSGDNTFSSAIVFGQKYPLQIINDEQELSVSFYSEEENVQLATDLISRYLCAYCASVNRGLIRKTRIYTSIMRVYNKFVNENYALYA